MPLSGIPQGGDARTVQRVIPTEKEGFLPQRFCDIKEKELFGDAGRVGEGQKSFDSGHNPPLLRQRRQGKKKTG